MPPSDVPSPAEPPNGKFSNEKSPDVPSPEAKSPFKYSLFLSVTAF